MKAKEYNLVQMCVENGVRLGLGRAYKHTEQPTYEDMIDAINSAVMNELCEWFDFSTSSEESYL